jgi:hypothetical protein
MGIKMENNPHKPYDKVDSEEIIIKLKEILAYFQKLKQEGEDLNGR